MGAAWRAEKGTALTHDTATNNEEEKPWVDKRHFSVIIYFICGCIAAAAAGSTLYLLTSDIVVSSCSALIPSLVYFSPRLYTYFSTA